MPGRFSSCLVVVISVSWAAAASSQPSIELGGTLEEDDFDFVVSGLPAVAADGSRVAVADTAGDGGRGNPNLTLRIFDAADGRELEHVLLLTANEYHVASERDYGGQRMLEGLVGGRLEVARELLAGTTWVPLERLTGERSSPTEVVLVDSTGAVRVERSGRQVTIRGTGAPDYQHQLTWSPPVDDDCTGWETFLDPAWGSPSADVVVLRWWFSSIGYCGEILRTEVVSHRRANAPPPAAVAGAHVDARAGATALRHGVVHHEPDWQAVIASAAPVSTQLRPGADATVQREGTTLTIAAADGQVVETLVVPADADVLLGDVLDPSGRRGERLDEVVVVASDGSTTVYAYDWRSEGRVEALSLPAADPRECRAAAFDGAWGLVILPSRNGGTALAVGDETRLLRWSPTGWCSQGRAVTITPTRVLSGSGQSVEWAADLDGDGNDDRVTMDSGGFTWQADGSDTSQRIEIEDVASGWDPMYALYEISGWLSDGRTAYLLDWSFDSDPSDGDSYGSVEHVVAPGVDGGIIPLINVRSSGSGTHHYNDDETEFQVTGDYERRTLSFQRLGDAALLLKLTQVDDLHLEPRPSQRRLSWSWFYVGDAGQLDVDHNYQSWSGTPEEAPTR